MSRRNKDAAQLAELRGIAYATALAAIRAENDRGGRTESLHQTALRMISEASITAPAQEPGRA